MTSILKGYDIPQMWSKILSKITRSVTWCRSRPYRHH